VAGTSFRKVGYFPWKLLRRQDQRLSNTYLFRPLARVELYHLWNGVCLNHLPWVTSFEMNLPRYGRRDDCWTAMALDRLHRPECRKLLPLSDFARHFFCWQHRGKIDSQLRDKMEVFPGGVEVATGEEGRRKAPNGEEFLMCFIGHDFFRKGGIAVLRAFERLKGNLPQLKLAVVSSVIPGDYVTATGPEDALRVREALASDRRIDWRERASHAEVMSLLSRAHLALLPTLDDTLGWSVLEAMSVGLPVIGTNVCAMPELVEDGVTGLHINLPLQENRRWAGMAQAGGSPLRAAAMALAYDIIEDALTRMIPSLAENPEMWLRMSRAAVAHVRRHHNPTARANRLRTLYEETIA
jgi:glycosyltransferase involved in cell wall biosynthesis